MTHESTQERAAAMVTLYGAEQYARGLLEGLRVLELIETQAAMADGSRTYRKADLISAIRGTVSRYRRTHEDALALVEKT